MNKVRSIILALMAGALMFSSCTTYKQFGYFQDIKKATLQPFPKEYEGKIMPDDRLQIVVFGPDPQVVAPYNLVIGTGGMNGANNTFTYLVDKDGVISFPTLGDIKVSNMTRRELEKYLTKKISSDVKDPTVIVNFENHSFTILGDVASPGTYRMESERIGIMKAIGMAGDLNISAKRNHILLVREENGMPVHYTLDLKTAMALSDEHYFLQNNDILYVRPGAARVTERTFGFWSVFLNAITSIATTGLLWNFYGSK